MRPGWFIAGVSALGAATAATVEGESFVDALGQFAGRLHPIIVHFPIGLIVTACLLELWRGLRHARGPSPTAMACLAFGTAGAAAAAGAGWLNADYERGDAGPILLEVHRWIGVSVAAAAAVVLVLGAAAARLQRQRIVPWYRLGLALAAVAVSVGGYLGGMLALGDGYVGDAVAAVIRPGSPPAGPVGGSRVGASAADVRMPASGVIEFGAHVRPILAAACFECHGGGKERGGLVLESKAAAFKGGRHGPVIVAGKPDESLLIRRVLGLDDEDRMPFQRDPLPEEQIKILRAWVEQGAAWPDAQADVAAPQARHWAYVPPVRREEPRVKRAGWVLNPIDSFVLARLEREGLLPSPEADRATLIRRVTLDLTGLPTTVEEVDAFVTDRGNGAYERVVDRLLASSRFGERWAKWWLDAARYADSQGYEKDGPRSIWPYRDWVIRAMNDDVPFDRFTVEQIAGDLLPEATTDQVIATGFHRNSMINEEGGVDPEEYRVNAVIDRASTTATVWLGATMGCAQCHDHKFDPFTQREYYAFFAFFNSTAEESTQGHGEFYIEISPKRWVPDPRDREVTRLIAAVEAQVGGGEAEAMQAAQMKSEVARGRRRPAVETLVMKEAERPRETHVHIKGDFRNKGEAVEPGVPAALPPLPEGEPRNRATLARWLVSPSNPLMARVTVNRIWEQYFGRGIVETTEDFGTRGSPPTHPELLDWLATEFVRADWSMKAVHRLIVTSATYRQASEVTPAALQRDPANVLLSRGARFRLDAETIRDQALAVGGLLSARIGGPSVYPVQPEGIWSNPYVDNRYPQSRGEDLHRRGLYTYWKRSSPYPSFVSFDAPPRQLACTRRIRSNTPLQSLTTLNDPVYIEAAAALAARIVKDGGTQASDRVIYGFRLCLARPPRGEELARLVALQAQQVEGFRADPAAAHALVTGAAPTGEAPVGGTGVDEAELAAWTVVANVLLNLDEMLTKG